MSNTIAEELIQEGEVRGALRTKQEYVLETLAARFADVPAEVARQIQAITDLSWLDALFRRALTVERLEDFVVA
jgi:hypothetical protein